MRTKRRSLGFVRNGMRVAQVVGALALACVPLAAQYDDGPGEVPYVPTPPEVVEAMLKAGGVKSGDIMYDLGCGDGRIVVMAIQKFHAARGTGIDINPVRIKEAEENARQAGVSDRVRFIEKNLFDADVHDATVVTLYLLPDVNLRLRPILLKQLKAGSRIVSHAFDMGDWKPDKRIDVNGRTVYLWTVTDQAKREFGAPERAGVDGEWVFHMPSPNGEVEAGLTLKSEGGHLTGTFVFPDNRRLEIQEGTMDGKSLKFTVRRDRQSGGAMIYKMSGTLEGDQIKGTTETSMDGQNVSQSWSAKRK